VFPCHFLLVALVGWVEREQGNAADFFTTEVWTARRLVTYYTLFVIELECRRVQIVGSTRHPDEAFMLQAMRHLTDDVDGVLRRRSVLICDRDRNGVGP
jgi:hypothetical protein